MELYLVRHAIAYPQDPATWPDDSLRPLTDEGEERFRRAARGLRVIAPAVDVVLASPWVRAWRTAELLAEEAGWPKPERCEALEGGRSPREAIESIRRQPVAAVAAVGHEPSLSELASTLLTGNASRAHIELKKGGVILLDLSEGMRPAGALLRWVVTPRILRSLAH